MCATGACSALAACCCHAVPPAAACLVCLVCLPAALQAAQPASLLKQQAPCHVEGLLSSDRSMSEGVFGAVGFSQVAWDILGGSQGACRSGAVHAELGVATLRWCAVV